MPAHESPVTVGEPIAIPGSADLASIDVTLFPPEHPELAFVFQYLLGPGAVRYTCGFRVEPRPDIPAEKRAKVGAALVRDLPLSRWEKAARAAVQEKVEGATPWMWRVASSKQEIAERAQQIVKQMHPEIDPNAGKGAARSWNRLVRLAEVVLETEAQAAAGAKSPATVVAEKREVAPATVRSWLHQAKQEGIAAGTIPLEEFERRFPGLISHVVVHQDGSAEDRSIQ